MLVKAVERGFSLIELMVTVAVMVVLALLAAPSMLQYTESSKIVGAAEMFYASAQQARAEAIRRNSRVELVLTNQSPIAANVDMGASGLKPDGPNWMVRELPKDDTDTYKFVEGKQGAEGGGRAGGDTTMVIAAGSTNIEFGPLGSLSGGGPISVDFSSARSTCAQAGGTTRCLRVVISTGGQARLCDPAVSATNDSRKC